jgi:hypothetical protein
MCLQYVACTSTGEQLELYTTAAGCCYRCPNLSIVCLMLLLVLLLLLLTVLLLATAVPA